MIAAAGQPLYAPTLEELAKISSARWSQAINRAAHSLAARLAAPERRGVRPVGLDAVVVATALTPIRTELGASLEQLEGTVQPTAVVAPKKKGLPGIARVGYPLLSPDLALGLFKRRVCW